MIPAAYSVGNFKAIGAPQTIPIRPITLIFGQNSAGKSSLIQSLLLCRDALENQGFEFEISPKWGPLVDLGGFQQYVHRHDTKRDLILEFRFRRSELEREQSAADSESLRILGVDSQGDYQNWSFCYLNRVRDIGLRFEVGLWEEPARMGAKEIARVKSVQLLLDSRGILSFTLNARGVLALDAFEPYAEAIMGGMVFLAKEYATHLRDTEANARIGLPRILERLNPAGSRGSLKITDSVAALLEQSGLIVGRPSGRPSRQQRNHFERFLAAVADRLTDELRGCQVAGNGLSLSQLPQTRLKDSRLVIESRLNKIVPGDSARSEADQSTTVEIHTIDNPVRFFIEEQKYGDALGALAQAFRFDVELVLDAAFSSVTSWLKSLHYLAPFREVPARGESPSRLRDTDITADWMHLPQDPRLIAKLNYILRERLDCPYRLVVRTTAPEVDYRSLQDKVERIFEARRRIDRIQEGDQSLRNIFSEMLKGKGIERVYLIDARNETELDLCDVGFGVSQVLPILIEAVTRETGFLCVEQPELHLHPKMQADLADIFIPKSEDLPPSTRKFYLLETHSEHLILRLLRRVRESHDSELSAAKGTARLRPEQISVNYVRVEDGEARVTNIAITEDGDFDREWPQGFFDERAKELFG